MGSVSFCYAMYVCFQFSLSNLKGEASLLVIELVAICLLLEPCATICNLWKKRNLGLFFSFLNIAFFLFLIRITIQNVSRDTKRFKNNPKQRKSTAHLANK